VYFVNFLPAVSDDCAKAIRRAIKRWRLHLWSGRTLAYLAREINPIVRGWINYYGGFYLSRLLRTLRLINEYLARWAMRKYKRLRGRRRPVWAFLERVARCEPGLFVHWQTSCGVTGWVVGAR
jgi:RNA-directed DNA polymerase